MNQESTVKILYFRIKNWAIENENILVLSAGFLLIVIISFGLGRLWEQQIDAAGRKAPIIVNKSKSAFVGTNANIRIDANDTNNANNSNTMANILYVASKKGEYYHLPNCPGAKMIKPENKIEFHSKEEAENRGYKPASNCPWL